MNMGNPWLISAITSTRQTQRPEGQEVDRSVVVQSRMTRVVGDQLRTSVMEGKDKIGGTESLSMIYDKVPRGGIDLMVQDLAAFEENDVGPIEVDQKRKRVDLDVKIGPSDVVMVPVVLDFVSSKNGLKAGPGSQARQTQ